MAELAAVITVSDKGARGERVDTSGPALAELLARDGWEVVYRSMVPDDAAQIQKELKHCADELHLDLVLTTGGTGFSPRDITPEATMAVVERPTPGIPEAMRAASMQITPRGCLSRSAAGIRGGTLIVNLPGSEKASRENLAAVLPALRHGISMLRSSGSADCAAAPAKRQPPSLDAWLREAKSAPEWDRVGMYLVHNGVVRRTAKAAVRGGDAAAKDVTALTLTADADKVAQAIAEAKRLPGVYYVRVWLNEGTLQVGDDMMCVLVGGDIRPHVIDALQFLVGRIKQECVTETEHT